MLIHQQNAEIFINLFDYLDENSRIKTQCFSCAPDTITKKIEAPS